MSSSDEAAFNRLNSWKDSDTDILVEFSVEFPRSSIKFVGRVARGEDGTMRQAGFASAIGAPGQRSLRILELMPKFYLPHL